MIPSRIVLLSEPDDVQVGGVVKYLLFSLHNVIGVSYDPDTFWSPAS